jgi:hypothetical protein
MRLLISWLGWVAAERPMNLDLDADTRVRIA